MPITAWIFQFPHPHSFYQVLMGSLRIFIVDFINYSYWTCLTLILHLTIIILKIIRCISINFQKKFRQVKFGSNSNGSSVICMFWSKFMVLFVAQLFGSAKTDKITETKSTSSKINRLNNNNSLLRIFRSY